MTATPLRHRYVQGPNGFFAEEIKAEQEIKQSPLFYSRLKKLCIGIPVTMIMIYVLYKQFYTAS